MSSPIIYLTLLLTLSVHVISAPVPYFWSSLAGATGGIVSGNILMDWFHRHRQHSRCSNNQPVCLNGNTTLNHCLAIQTGYPFTMGVCNTASKPSSSSAGTVIIVAGQAAPVPQSIQPNMPQTAPATVEGHFSDSFNSVNTPSQQQPSSQLNPGQDIPAHQVVSNGNIQKLPIIDAGVNANSTNELSS